MREEKEEGGWRESGSLPWRVWGESMVLHVHQSCPLVGQVLTSLPTPSPLQGLIHGLPCSPANSPASVPAFFSFCSFLKLPFKRS